MQLKPGFESEYKTRHDEIWPELSQALTAAGIRDYSIFLDEETGSLFAVHGITEANTLDSLPTLLIMKKWWTYMADIMETHPNNEPIASPLRQVFHMD